MQYQVPQFINIEDKILGPFTIKQSVYIAGGAGGVFLLYKLLPLYLSIFLIIPVAGLAIALAFVKINNKPFIFTMQAALAYVFGTHLYIGKKVPKEITSPEELLPNAPKNNVPTLSRGNLKELAWKLDVHEAPKR